jgi:hypothetical protein
MALTGVSDERAGAHLSLGLSVVSLVGGIALAVLLYGEIGALPAAILLAGNPMDLVVARRCWGDSCMSALSVVLVLTAAWYYLGETRGRRWYPVLFLLGIVPTTVKESGAALFLVVLVLLATGMMRERRWGDAARLGVVAIGSLATGFILWILVSGGLHTTVTVYRNVSTSVPFNRYAVQYQDGPWFSFVESALAIAPLTTPLFLIGIGVLIRIGAVCCGSTTSLLPPKRSALLVGMVTLIVTLVGAASIPQYFKNLRYLSPLFVPFGIIAALPLSLALRLALTRSGPVKILIPIGILAVALVVAVTDYYRFDDLILRQDVVDPNPKMLRDGLARLYP